MPVPKHMRHLTTWQVFHQVDRMILFEVLVRWVMCVGGREYGSSGFQGGSNLSISMVRYLRGEEVLCCMHV